MSAYRVFYLSLLVALSFAVSYILNLCILSILLDLGLDVTLAIVSSAILSVFGTIGVSDMIEKASSVISDVTFNFKSFIRNKKEEFEAKQYNAANGITFISKESSNV